MIQDKKNKNRRRRRRRRREEIREERKRKAHNFIEVHKEDLEGGGVASCSGEFGYFLH